MTIHHRPSSKRHRFLLAVVAAVVLLVLLSLSTAMAILQFPLSDMSSISSVLSSLETLQASHASRTPTEVASDCSNLFLYIPMEYENNGLASQLQNYVLALHTAALFHRTLVVTGPSGHETPLSSPLGCRPEANQVNLYLLDLLDIPTSNACAQALCVKRYTEWEKIIATSGEKSEIATITCHKIAKTDPTSVMITGGYALRRIHLENVQLAKQPGFSQWVPQLGSTPQQLEFFKNTSNTIDDMWMGVAGLLAPKIQWRPFVREQVTGRIKDMRLPPHYVAFHVRRGDKLVKEAAKMVKEYWETRGGNRNNLNYLPLEAYVTKLNVLSDPRDVYIATDDPVTVGKEVERLKALGSYWKFHLLSDHHHSQSGHLLVEQNCTVRYDMTIDAIVDLEVLTRADVFVGELNSNWGRYIHTMRTNFTGSYPTVRDFRFAFPAAKVRFLGD